MEEGRAAAGARRIGLVVNTSKAGSNRLRMSGYIFCGRSAFNQVRTSLLLQRCSMLTIITRQSPRYSQSSTTVIAAIVFPTHEYLSCRLQYTEPSFRRRRRCHPQQL